MVVAEQELAAKIGLQIMARGGNAVDAAVATSLAVGLTNPSSCGIGGGGFMLIYWARTNKVYALDYRERAGALATPGLYIRDGKPIDDRTRNGAMAVAVPGEINGLYNALHRFGTMQFSDVAAPTIALGRNGFPCGKHLADEIERTRYALAADPELKKVFLHSDGTPRKEGETIVEADLAHTLQTFDNHPISHFYHGPVARNLVNYLRPLGGVINIADLDDYKVYWREPLHHSYRGYDVYSMPPPSSGGATVLESLAALSPGNIAGLGLNSPAYLARLIEILRQGFADRALFGDPNFVDVPIGFLLSPQHISEMRARAFGKKSPPPAPVAQDHGTSQLCVVDEQGNVVSITTTINTPFGAKLMVPKLGIILNNEMDDFGLSPDIGNAYGLRGSNPNAIGPGKRPVSSMSPTIVLRDHHPVLTLGGSGGPTIISGTLQVALAILDAHLDPERAVKLPRIHEQGSPDTVAVEAAMPNATIRALMKMGYKVKIVPMLGAVQAIEISPQLLRGAFDPRKGGGAVGY
ncbi:MAG TPA: gamma-glutamyltransferase [Candidatus Binataceae bacterium]|nr:gamma-glutamyltransferase [Candidatus Binataceae bacterium]